MAKIVIENFMTENLGLNGNQLVLYAIMWRDSKNGTQPVNEDYVRYSGAINTTIPTYYATMKKLVERGYITKMKNGSYVVNDVKR